MVEGSSLREQLTLDDAIIAAKVLEARAKHYRDQAAGGSLHANDVRIYVARAAACERVALVLLSGARVD